MTYHGHTKKLHGIMYLQPVAGFFLQRFIVERSLNDLAMYPLTARQER